MSCGHNPARNCIHAATYGLDACLALETRYPINSVRLKMFLKAASLLPDAARPLFHFHFHSLLIWASMFYESTRSKGSNSLEPPILHITASLLQIYPRHLLRKLIYIFAALSLRCKNFMAAVNC